MTEKLYKECAGLIFGGGPLLVRAEDAERYATFGRLVIASGCIDESDAVMWGEGLADLREKKPYDDEEVEPGETYRQRWDGEIARLAPVLAAYRAIEEHNETEL